MATALARASAAVYAQLEHDGVAGLEVATTDEAMADLQRRAGLAAEAGLPAQVLDAVQAAACAPELVDSRRCVGGVLYPADGTARASTITAALAQRATGGGARFVHDAAVTAIDTHGNHVRCTAAAAKPMPPTTSYSPAASRTAVDWLQEIARRYTPG